MKTNKEVKISYWAHHLTTIISVTLVLILMGIIAMIWVGADTETRRLKERLEISVIMSDSIPEGTVRALADKISREAYAGNVKTISKEEALSNWTRDTGEDLQELFGVNPLTEEITINVKAGYASTEQLNVIKRQLEAAPGVDAVSMPDTEMVKAMNDNISRLTVVLVIVAAIMLLISFVLINNTVHLTIYSRRFTIHTMKLVGATNGFIRRPIILNNMLAGLISGIFASAILALAMAGADKSGLPDITSYIGWGAYAAVAAGMTVAGVLLCGIASLVSANTYLRKDYDQLFK